MPGSHDFGQQRLPSRREWEILLSRLFLVSRDLPQNRRLDHFLFFFRLIDRLPSRIHQPRGYKNDQVAFDMLIDIGSEQPADHRKIAKERSPILNFLNVFAH